ncbi:MipA/OmpV family protein [Burkholderia gladioli]|nr:hypothetical protein CEJ98_13855 [Burkholderia gladioli pv. gladioli]AWY54795.1 hypothetical protein A8H28_27275 [Burkholderia gladioli pv. gladioli]PEH37809.1 MipA/OmpV family protein [Burkholderia gladioli]QPQ85333.1 MipA/OmpV family protein [Burkholderia gladioli]
MTASRFANALRASFSDAAAKEDRAAHLAREQVGAAAARRKARSTWWPFLAITSFFISSVASADDGAGSDPSGFTLLSNATNVTHWGLGAGAEVQTMPYKHYGANVAPIPLIYFDDKWVNVVGTTVDLKVGQWDSVSIALRGRVGILEGYKQSDAPVLNGMQNRDSVAFWYGPTLAWDSALGTLSSSYLFGGNKGRQASLDFRKEIQAARWTVVPHMTVEWLSGDYVDYYYGVTPSEMRPGRPAYKGSSASKVSIGTRVAYQLTEHQSVGVDISVAHLGGGITDSPLVGRRFVTGATLGYVYQFR